MRIYFDYPENATQARTELISFGVPEDDVRLEIHQGGGGIREGLKRARGDETSEATHGATVIIDEVDWLLTQKAVEVARRHDGKIRAS
jgi:hypothetical protein